MNEDAIGCPNKSIRFKVRAIVILLGWQHWNFSICHLSFLWLVVIERYTKEQHIIIVKIYYNIYYKIKSCALIGTPLIYPKYYDWKNSVPSNLNAWTLWTVHNVNMGYFIPHE